MGHFRGSSGFIVFAKFITRYPPLSPQWFTRFLKCRAKQPANFFARLVDYSVLDALNCVTLPVMYTNVLCEILGVYQQADSFVFVRAKRHSRYVSKPHVADRTISTW